MISKHFYTIALAASLVCGPALAAPSRAVGADEAILAAHAAFRAGDPVKLARYAAALEGHVLQPYVEYWQLKVRLDEMPSTEVRAYLAKYPGSYLADRLRSDWLKELGKRRDWQTFDLEFAALSVDDADTRCYALASRLSRGDESTLTEVSRYWHEPKELPEGCVGVAEEAIARGKFTAKHVWRRVRLLLEAGQMTAARRAMEYLPAAERPDERLLTQAATSAAKLVARPPEDLSGRGTREMVLFAIVRLARSDPRLAAEFVNSGLGQKLPAADRSYLWGRVAFEAAKRLLPEAAEWYAKAGDADFSDDQLAWKARAALRAGNWAMVTEAIDAMTVAAHADPAWTYWYARGLAAQGKADGARAYYLRIAGQPDFYGLLASEELGQPVTVPAPAPQPTEEQVARAKALPGLTRALELFRLNLRTEGVREWVYSIRGLDDSQLLAAAELARRAELYDRAINTADRTTGVHDYKVRFLAPFRETFRAQSQAFGVEEAWLYGLTRQESRFIANARSSAGAQGLMQLMPTTARWVARKIGLTISPSRVIEVDTNVTLGARYVKLVLDDLGHPVMASAAYNAGPGRARRWRDVKPLEGAIYAESIPFNETRDYVKKVMANTYWYALLMEGTSVPLKSRLGTMPAKAAGDKFNEDLP
ncbi:MAG: lytic transglycosylase domain-containing protein [Proteobacteria bacterium]|nr:lytic transglycosylase domain-containing protein [Pseudomonadota bacterium]